MKKYYLIAGLALGAIVFSNCNPSKKTTTTSDGTKSTAAKVTYDGQVSTVIMSRCSPCHIPSKGGNKKAYDNYANVKADIDDIIHRIELNPGDRGFMPFRGSKLPEAEINVFKQFKADGSVEK